MDREYVRWKFSKIDEALSRCRGGWGLFDKKRTPTLAERIGNIETAVRELRDLLRETWKDVQGLKGISVD